MEGEVNIYQGRGGQQSKDIHETMAGISRVEGVSLVVYDTLFHQISPPLLGET